MFWYSRAGSRHWPPHGRVDDRGGRTSGGCPGGGADLGEPARACITFSRRDLALLPHHYRNAGRIEEAFAGGYYLDAYSLDTVKMFYNDAVSAGFKLEGFHSS